MLVKKIGLNGEVLEEYDDPTLDPEPPTFWDLYNMRDVLNCVLKKECGDAESFNLMIQKFEEMSE